MGNNNLNVLSKCSVAFLSTGSALLIMFVIIMMTNDTVAEMKVFKDNSSIKWGFFIGGLLFTFGSWLCSLLNRTKAVPDVSINNWANGFFFFGLLAPIFLTLTGCFLFRGDKEKLLDNKLTTITLLLSISAGTWMFLVPDLMPKECVPN
jgi:hypothetical protein